MGLFKQMKQMKDVMNEAPDLVRSSMEMQQAMQAAPPPAATAGAAPGGVAGGAATPLDDETIGNVSLARYAEICRTGTERGVTDLPGVAAIAAEHGVNAADWDVAVNGWNSRFTHDTAAAMRFNALWRGIG
jgi:hypothetical protein